MHRLDLFDFTFYDFDNAKQFGANEQLREQLVAGGFREMRLSKQVTSTIEEGQQSHTRGHRSAQRLDL